MMINYIIREAVNAAIFGLFLCMTWRFWQVMRTTDRNERPRLYGAAQALTIVFAGEVGRSALAWFSLSAVTSKWPSAWVDTASPAWIISGILIMIGGLLCIRAFPEVGNPRRGMVVASVMVAACLLVSVLT